MKKSELTQDDSNDDHNEDIRSDSPFVSPRILGEYAKLDSRQKSRI